MDKIKRITSIIVVFVCCFVYLHDTSKQSKIVTVSLEERDYLKVVLVDSINRLVPVSLEVPFIMDELESIQTAIEYMSKNKSYHGLNGYLNSNASINSIVIDGDIAYVDVNKSFFSVNAKENRRVAEGLIMVIQGNSSFDEIVLSIDGNLLVNIPYTSIPIKNALYSLPMNVFESEDVLHTSIPITKYSLEKIGSKVLLVPITYYMKGERSVEFLLDVFSDIVIDEGFFSYLNNVYEKYSIDEGKLTLYLNNSLCLEENVIEESVLNMLLLMLFDNLSIHSIELLIDEQPYYYQSHIKEINRKDLVYNIWEI